jgi:hypothetical protein
MSHFSSSIILGLSLFVISGCSNIREQTTFPMGNNRYTISVRGNSYATQEQVKSAWYRKALGLCKSGFTVEKIETKERVIGSFRKPVLEGIVVCK